MLYVVIFAILAQAVMFVLGNKFGCDVTTSQIRADLMDGEVEIDGCRYLVQAIEFPAQAQVIRASA